MLYITDGMRTIGLKHYMLLQDLAYGYDDAGVLDIKVNSFTVNY